MDTHLLFKAAPAPVIITRAKNFYIYYKHSVALIGLIEKNVKKNYFQEMVPLALHYKTISKDLAILNDVPEKEA